MGLLKTATHFVTVAAVLLVGFIHCNQSEVKNDALVLSEGSLSRSDGHQLIMKDFKRDAEEGNLLKSSHLAKDGMSFKNFAVKFSEKLTKLKAMNTVYQKHSELMGEFQGALIDVMSSSYDFGRLLHKLHHTVRHLQQDIKTLKDKLSSHYEKYKKHDGVSNYLDLLPQKEQSSFKTAMMVEIEKMTTKNITDIVETTTNRKYSNLEHKLTNLQKEVKKDKAMIVSKDKQLKMIMKDTKKKDKIITEQADTIHELRERMDWVEKTLMRMYRQRNRMEAQKVEEAKKADCPNGFFRYAMSCYKFENLTMNWDGAERHCQDRHTKAHLISIETEDENQFVLSYRKYNQAKWSSPWLWAGGTDRALEGVWKWTGSDKVFGYTYWTKGEPNGDRKQNCLYFTGGGKQTWDDWDCHNLFINFVCEIALDEPL